VKQQQQQQQEEPLSKFIQFSLDLFSNYGSDAGLAAPQ
jgi:hypothetical protein